MNTAEQKSTEPSESEKPSFRRNIKKALDEYMLEQGCDPHQGVRDLITDLMHSYSDLALPFYDIVGEAGLLFREECQPEGATIMDIRVGGWTLFRVKAPASQISMLFSEGLITLPPEAHIDLVADNGAMEKMYARLSGEDLVGNAGSVLTSRFHIASNTDECAVVKALQDWSPLGEILVKGEEVSVFQEGGNLYWTGENNILLTAPVVSPDGDAISEEEVSDVEHFADNGGKERLERICGIINGSYQYSSGLKI